MPFVTLALLASAWFQADALLDSAHRAEQAGKFSDAERFYEQAVAAQPNAETWQRLGLVRHLQNKFSEAIPAFREAVRGNPKLWGAYLFLGIDYYRTNQFQLALESLERASALTTHNEIDFWLGASHLALKHYLQGLQILERLHGRDPANLEVVRVLVQNYAEYGTALWNDVAERHPDTSAGYEVHGRALELEGANQPALEAYRQALAMRPDGRGLHLAIGRVLLASGKSEEALAEFVEELKRRPGEPETSYQAGLALLRLKRVDEARAHLGRAAQWPQVAEESKQLLQTISAPTP